MCQQWHGTRNLKFFGTLQWTVLLLEQFSSSLSTLHAETFFRWERITELEYSSQICSFPFSLLFLIVRFFCMCAKRVLAQVLYLALDFFFFLKYHAVCFNGSDDNFPLLQVKGRSLLTQNLGLIFQLCLQKKKRKHAWSGNKYGKRLIVHCHLILNAFHT